MDSTRDCPVRGGGRKKRMEVVKDEGGVGRKTGTTA